MTRYAVVTTFNQHGLDLYAQRFIDTFDQNMPVEVDLYLYAENCSPKVLPTSRRKIEVVQVEQSLDKLMRFKAQYAKDRRVVDLKYLQQMLNKKSQTLTNRLHKSCKQLLRYVKFLCDGRKRKPVEDSIVISKDNRYMWDFIRFSHKSYAVIDASRRVNSEILIWMDADSVVHSKVPIQFLDDLIEKRYFTHYLARKHPVQGSVYTECGWYSMNLRHQYAREFFNQFERMYEQAETGVFSLPCWTDCHVFDHVRIWHERKYGTDNKSISGKGYFTGHPLVNSCLGQYFDHLQARLFRKRLLTFISSENGNYRQFYKIYQYISSLLNKKRAILFVSCDTVYFNNYFHSIYQSTTQNSPDINIWVNIINPTVSDIRTIKAIKRKDKTHNKKAQLYYSLEYKDFSNPNHTAEQKKTYYASSRFIKLHRLLSLTKRDIIALDIDSIVLGDITKLQFEMDLTEDDIAIRTRFHMDDVKDKFLASTIYARHTKNTKKFLLNFSKRIEEEIQKHRLDWFMDQVTLYETYLLLKREISLYQLPQKYVDWGFNRSSIIWTGKGDRKHKSSLWQAKQAEYAGNAKPKRVFIKKIKC